MKVQLRTNDLGKRGTLQRFWADKRDFVIADAISFIHRQIFHFFVGSAKTMEMHVIAHRYTQ